MLLIRGRVLIKSCFKHEKMSKVIMKGETLDICIEE